MECFVIFNQILANTTNCNHERYHFICVCKRRDWNRLHSSGGSRLCPRDEWYRRNPSCISCREFSWRGRNRNPSRITNCYHQRRPQFWTILLSASQLPRGARAPKIPASSKCQSCTEASTSSDCLPALAVSSAKDLRIPNISGACRALHHWGKYNLCHYRIFYSSSPKILSTLHFWRVTC